MNGTISAKKNNGTAGSTFYFNIEMKKSNRKEKDTKIIFDIDTIKDCSSINVLYLNDKNDLDSDNEIISILSDLNVNYQSSSFIEDSIQKLLATKEIVNNFDFVIVDRHISSNIDIERFSKLINDNNDRLSNLQLILISSVGLKGDAKKYSKLGFSAYLTTPITKFGLQECFTELIDNDKSKKFSNDLITNHTINEKYREKVKILLVEDNETNMFLARELFSEFGYLADEAWNGEEAVEKIQSKNYDLVFMDIQMPVMDGLTATKKIRELRNNVPIIAMTANAIKGDKERCINAGMNDYISKPIDPRKVLISLKKWTKKNYSSIYDENDDIFNDISVEFASYDIENQEESIDKNVKLSFDPTILMKLLKDKKDKVKKICDIFIADTPNEIQELEEALNIKDFEVAIRMAHTIKGSSANIGANILREIALEIENDGKNNNFAKITELLPKMKYEFYKLEKSIKEYFEEDYII